MTANLTDIAPEDARWDAIGFDALAEQVCIATLQHLGLQPSGFEISILACNDARISGLNGTFRDKDAPTNVLSWPSQDRARPHRHPKLPAHGADGMPVELGDIAISYDTCVAEAAAADKSVTDHVTHLLIHGVLHLLGYDHISDQDAAIMEALEVEVLGKLGISDPYRG